MARIELLLRRFAAARSRNARQRILTDVGSVATPVELRRLVTRRWPGLDIPFHGPVWREWCADMTRMVRAAGKDRPEPFVRERLVPGVIRYRWPGSPPEAKTLVVGFKGNANRYMMPLPALLQHLDARRVDFVSVSSRGLTRETLRKVGAKASGLAAGPQDVFLRTLLRVRDVVGDPAGYRRLSVLGASSGGLLAVIAARVMGASHVLAAGAGSPYEAWWEQSVAFDPVEYLTSASATWTARTTLAFGTGSHVDAVNAREIAELVPARIHPVSDPSGRPVNHPCLYDLLRLGELTGFLEDALGLDP